MRLAQHRQSFRGLPSSTKHAALFEEPLAFGRTLEALAAELLKSFHFRVVAKLPESGLGEIECPLPLAHGQATVDLLYPACFGFRTGLLFPPLDHAFDFEAQARVEAVDGPQ